MLKPRLKVRGLMQASACEFPACLKSGLVIP